MSENHILRPSNSEGIVTLPPTIFNTQKTDYGRGQSLFFGQQAGLFDTIHRPFPKIWENYKNMKSLDWDELEFDFRGMAMEFATHPKAMSSTMINVIAWQWEADTVAARTLLPVMAPFISSTELQAAYGRITDNEVLHAATYSEIVKYSFTNPSQVLNDVLANQDALRRMQTVSKILAKVYELSHKYALGQIKFDQALYNMVYLAVVAMLCLERIQFIASFAVTFAIGELGAFMQICKAVQKICQDEYEVHVSLGREIIRNEHKNVYGAIAKVQTEVFVRRMIREFIASEFAFINTLSLDEGYLPALTARGAKEWVLLGAGDVYNTLGMKPDADISIPTTNPLPYMEHWMDISDTQSSPQEQRNNQYKTNILMRDDDATIFEVNF